MNLETQNHQPKKRRNKKQITGSRWAIFFVFLITSLLSFVFWLSPQLTNFWQGLKSPLVIVSSQNQVDEHLDLGPIKDPQKLIAQFKEMSSNLAGDYGFVVWALKDDRVYGSKEEKIFPAASLMKLPVMITYFRQVEAGELKSWARYVLKDEDKIGGAGMLINQSAGAFWTNDQLISFMGKYSDNTAFAIIREKVGEEKINQTIEDLKMEKTNLTEFETTPLDIARLFKAVFDEGVINKPHRQDFLDSLTETVFEKRIPEGISEKIKVAHKVGTDMGTYSDGGIIFSADPFILVVMSKNAAQGKAETFIADFTSLVYKFETEEN